MRMVNKIKQKLLTSALFGITLSLLIMGLINVAVVTGGTVPTTGVVQEGVSVPEVSLGDTRAEVVESWGEPKSCQYPDSVYCKYEPPEGFVTVNYMAADGGQAYGADTDVVRSVGWYYMYGWVTTAGINSDIAKNDPEAVIAAYPDAIVRYDGFGLIWSVTDYNQGFSVSWHRNPYPLPTVTVPLTIFYPRDPPPPPEPYNIEVHSESIDMSLTNKKVVAKVRVHNDVGWNMPGATISAVWTLPNGDTVPVTGVTDGFGLASFEVRKSKGTFVFTIHDISLDEYVFDADSSVLSNQIDVGKGKRK
jgi:hypothetical protein